MNKRLDIFVDESGHLSFEKDGSRFFLICLLLHDPANSIDAIAHKLNEELDRIGLSNLCFHAGPVIRHEDGYQYMNWQLRARIFSMMMAFARKADFRYRCVCVDKKFTTSYDKMLATLKSGIHDFLDSIPENEALDVFYDCGQAPITNLLHSTFESHPNITATFVQGVRPDKYRLFQVADLICTVSLMARKIDANIPLTRSEDKFFGGIRRFKRNILKPLLAKIM